MTVQSPTWTRQTPPVLGLPGIGKTVDANLLAERTKKGGWRARHEPTVFSVPVQDLGKIPPDKQPGDIVMLIITSINTLKQEINFKAP